MSVIRLLIIDDHNIMREGLRLLLDAEADIEVIAEASNGVEALEKARCLQPDITLLDIAMPQMDGLQAIGLIRAACSETRIIILSRYEKEEYARQALTNGAHGYVIKGAPGGDLLKAIREVSQGRYFFSDIVQAAIVGGYVKSQQADKVHADVAELSEREIDVLRLLAEGNTSCEIGVILCISSKTVDKHRASIARKTGAGNPVKMVQFALRTGLIAPDFWDK